MIIDWNARERAILAPEAMFSINSKGRLREEKDCPMRSCYQRDRDRILHSKSFRRMKQKTQVFTEPDSDHFRTRMTHSLEVMQIARTIARALSLNEDLVEAIALGHDMGHTPFGHGGERALAEIYGHFRHNEQSLRVVDLLENEGNGLNLTFEVRSGILNHSGTAKNVTLEGELVQLADRIAYVNHDLDDAIRAGLVLNFELPQSALAVLGNSTGKRVNTMVASVIEASQDLQSIRMNPREWEAMDEMRNFFMKNVYRSEEAVFKEEILTAQIKKTYGYMMENFDQVPEVYKIHGDQQRAVIDYIAGMTDTFALKLFKELKF